MSEEFKPYWSIVSMGDDYIFLKRTAIKYIATYEDALFFNNNSFMLGKFSAQEEAINKLFQLRDARQEYLDKINELTKDIKEV